MPIGPRMSSSTVRGKLMRFREHYGQRRQTSSICWQSMRQLNRIWQDIPQVDIHSHHRPMPIRIMTCIRAKVGPRRCWHLVTTFLLNKLSNFFENVVFCYPVHLRHIYRFPFFSNDSLLVRLFFCLKGYIAIKLH